MFLKKLDHLVGPVLSRLWLRPTQQFSFPTVNHLLLIRPGGIGDAVLLAPVLKKLRETFPGARIEVLAEKRNSEVFALCHCDEQVFCYDRPKELLTILRREYDVVIDTEQWYRLSALVARLIRSQVKIGYGTNIRQRLFTHRIDYRPEYYELHNFFELLKPLNINAPEKILFPFLSVLEQDQKNADTVLGAFLNEPFIALFPGASIPEKCWDVERFRQLARRFIDEGLAVVVIGGKGEAALGNSILSGAGTLNLAGKTSLRETAGVLNKAALLISGDSGVLHMAVGLGTPTVSIFGPSNLDKWAPRGREHLVISHRLPCSPCSRFGTTPPCPIGAKCIQDISVDEVFVAALKLLELKRGEVNCDAI